MMELEAEESWLRKRIVRLRIALRYASDPRIEVILREVIADAESRLEILQAHRGRSFQQQQQAQPKKGNGRAGMSAKALVEIGRAKFDQRRGLPNAK
jgi:hypothetical protein